MKFKIKMNVFISRKFLAVYECSLPRGSGLCLKLIHTIAYHPVKKECIPYTYGGCITIGDRFDSIQACESACKGK